MSRQGIIIGTHLCVFACLYSSLISQSPQSYTYTIADGMPTTEVSSVYCDSLGRIWSVHNNSFVSRFDGRKFVSYPPEVTGYYQAFGTFYEDRDGIWLLHSNNSISLFQNNHWRSWRKPFLAAVVDHERHRIVTIDTSGSFYLFDNDAGAWVRDTLTIAPPVSFSPDLRCEIVKSLDINQYLFRVLSNTYIGEHAFTTTSLINAEWVGDPTLLDAVYFWSSGKMTFNPVHNTGSVAMHSIHTPEVELVYQAMPLKDFLIMYTAEHYNSPSEWLIKIFGFSPQEGLALICELPFQHTGLTITFDKQNDLWIGSQAGLTRVDLEILHCREGVNGMVSGLHVIQEDDEGQIWFGGYTSGLCVFDGTKLHPAPDEARRFTRFLPGTFRDSTGRIAFWTEDYGIITYVDGHWSYSEERHQDPFGLRGYVFYQLINGSVAAGFQEKGFGITKALTPFSDWVFVDENKGHLLNNVLTIVDDRAGRIWTGRSSRGIALYDPVLDTAQTWLRADNPTLGFGSTASLLDHNGTLWMGCHDGLRFLPEPDQFEMFEDNVFERAIKVSMEEAGYTSVTLLHEHNNYLIFGNKLGYGFLDLNSQPDSPLIYFFNTANYLQSPDQNTILIDSKGYIWIGQDLGATRIDFEKLQFDTLPVEIIVDSVLVSGERLGGDARGSEGRREVSLPVFKRHMEIFLSPSFTGLLNDNVGFQSRLLHKNIQDTTWSAWSKDDVIKLSYLPPGLNTIEIRAIKNNQVADRRSLHFHVPLALSENPIFWICVIGALSLAVAIVSWRIYHQRLRIKRVQLELSEQRRETEQLQIKAITSSLNPHFLNNSLQWLQSRARKDPDAVKMIDRLAKNIQTVFVNSSHGKAFHSLRNEVDLVKNYLFIQQKRFGDFKEVSLPADEVMRRVGDIPVPLMQIQIHVENAIEHGLRVRPDSGKLIIDIEETGDDITIQITDDGIGRTRAKSLKAHGTQQGTKMLNSLHAIFNRYNTLPIVSEYIDEPFIDPVTNERYGTTVRIRIPKHYSYELPDNQILRH